MSSLCWFLKDALGPYVLGNPALASQLFSWMLHWTHRHPRHEAGRPKCSARLLASLHPCAALKWCPSCVNLFAFWGPGRKVFLLMKHHCIYTDIAAQWLFELGPIHWNNEMKYFVHRTFFHGNCHTLAFERQIPFTNLFVIIRLETDVNGNPVGRWRAGVPWITTPGSCLQWQDGAESFALRKKIYWNYTPQFRENG